MINLLNELKRLRKKVDKIRPSFRGRMSKVLDGQYYKNVVKAKIFIARDRSLLQTFSTNDYNIYLIRLIQIFQWTNGYYYGELDSAIGNRTYSALVDMAEYTGKLKLRFILSRLSGNNQGTKGFWILNIKYLFQELAKIISASDRDFTTRDLLVQYEQEFVDSESGSQKVGNALTDKYYDEIVEENKQDIFRKGKLRRIYYGAKSIAYSLISAFKKLIRFIKKGIKKLVYLIKNLIKIVYKEIREGVRKFRDGLHFFLESGNS